MKAAGVAHLPKLPEQPDAEYDSYKSRALFAEYMSRTVQGLTGAALFKPFQVELPSGLSHMLEDATASQMSLNSFISQLVTEMFITGRYGVLVDRGADDLSQPYLVHYTAQQVINWDEADGVLINVILEETYFDRDPVDKYKFAIATQWRELVLEDGIYSQRVWIKDPRDSEKFLLKDEVVPVRRGKPLDFIPFVITNTSGIGAMPDKPPLLAVATTNLSHYRNSADLENVRHYSGCPTLLIAGVKLKEGEAVRVGSGQAIVSADPGASGMYIEVAANGPGTLERALAQKEALMAVLGARLLEKRLPGVEAAETVKLRSMGDSYTLASINGAVADGLALALSFADIWQGGAGDVTVTPNTDFSDIAIGPQEMTALMALYQGGGMSLSTLLFNLHRAEMLPPDTTVEDEAALIDAAAINTDLNAVLPQLTPAEKAALTLPVPL